MTVRHWMGAIWPELRLDVLNEDMVQLIFYRDLLIVGITAVVIAWLAAWLIRGRVRRGRQAGCHAHAGETNGPTWEGLPSPAWACHTPERIGSRGRAAEQPGTAGEVQPAAPVGVRVPAPLTG